MTATAQTPYQRPAAPRPGVPRNTLIAAGVVVLHVLILWAMQTGLLRRAAEIIVPAELLSQIIEPAVTKPEPPPPPPPREPVRSATPRPAALPAAPQPVAIQDPTPAPNAPTGVTTPQPPPPPISAPVAVAAAPAAPAPAPKVELPSSDADYLNNPKPVYPPISKRLGEQGKVLVRVLIGADGLPQKAELRQSSGFDRLDQVALNTVMKWRYSPGKRGGVPEAMWFNVPLNFVLE
jgi:protein TonB